MPRRATKPKLETPDSKLKKLVELQLTWFAKNARDLPWRRTRDPYAIWVSEIMLQQTQVKAVIPYWERWMRELPTVESLAKASPDEIHKLWEGLGYYTRVRNMQKAAQFIVTNRAGVFPTDFDDVLSLPGIGRYTAGAICSIAFNQPAPILDGNVIRVLTRVFGMAENPREKEANAQLWSLAGKLVLHAKAAEDATASAHSRQIPFCSHLNQSLMELGALVCTPRAPQCLACPVSPLCLALEQGRTEELPNLGKRVEITERRFAAFVCQREGKFLVRQRPGGVVNAHLWEFPNAELLDGNSDPLDAARQVLPFPPKTVDPLCRIRHSITRYRITLEAFAVHGSAISMRAAQIGTWLTLAELKKLSFPSAHRKILCQLTSDS